MMPGARIALAIPARNAVAHLPRLLESVSQQTCRFAEVLLYDDASTDETGALAEAWGARVVRAARNTGPSVGKNILAAATDCPWIHFHDADEALRPEFVERATAWIANDDAFDVLLLSTEDRDDETGTLLAVRRWDDRALQDDAVAYNIRTNVTNCGVYRRAAFLAAGGFDTADEVRYNEDQAMHLRLAIAGLRFRSDAYVGTIVYRRANSMSSGNPIECARAQFHVLRQAADRVGATHGRELGLELWRVARVSASHRDWSYVRRALALARTLGCHDPVNENQRFRLAARMYPFGAVFAREQVIRLVKPHLRAGVPSARSSNAHS